MRLENVKTVIRSPRIGVAFARWLWQKKALGRAPVKTLRKNIALGSFSNFSEYLAVDSYVADDEYEFLQSYAFDDGQIIDIGANIGLFSLIIAKRFADRRIHAVEPNPATFGALQENLTRNSIFNVACHALAVSHASGMVRFSADPSSRATACIVRDEEAAKHIMVPSVSLNDFVEKLQIEDIALLKVDVEGYETSVFDGAEKLLRRRGAKVVYFEVCAKLATRAGFDPTSAARILERHGYRLYRFGGSGRLVAARAEEAADVELANWVAIAR